jgi:hypothetical protein
VSQDSLVLIKFIEEHAELLLPLLQEFGVTTTNELASWEWRKRACILLEQFLHNVLLEGSEDRISVTDQECHLLIRHGSDFNQVFIVLPIPIFGLRVIEEFDPEGVISRHLLLLGRGPIANQGSRPLLSLISHYILLI